MGTVTEQDNRLIERAEKMYLDGLVRRRGILSGRYWVRSATDPTKRYAVDLRSWNRTGNDALLHCSCPAHRYRSSASPVCKHIAASMYRQISKGA